MEPDGFGGAHGHKLQIKSWPWTLKAEGRLGLAFWPCAPSCPQQFFTGVGCIPIPKR